MRRSLAPVALAFLAGLPGSTSAAAQEPRLPGLRHGLEAARAHAAVESASVEEILGIRLATSVAADGDASVGAMSAVGIAVGAAGLLAGGLLGGALADDGTDDLDVLSGIVAGGAIGEGIGIPLGVHFADGRRGAYLPAAAASLGLAGVGLAALEAAHYDAPASPVILVAVPLAQLAASIAIERATAD